MNHKLVNLTPHPITILLNGGQDKIILPPSPNAARIGSDTGSLPPLVVEDGYHVPLTVHKNLHISNLPDPENGVIYVAPLIVAQAAKRADVMSPDRLIRDANGQPMGCYGLVAHA